MTELQIDLHTHSSHSDGTDSPAELVENAKKAGLDVVGLTDHDTTSGWDEAEKAAERCDITLVKGVEMTTKHGDRTVHLLGYGFDPANAALVAEFELGKESRQSRLDGIIAKLAETRGWDISADEVIQAADGSPLSKQHVADVLIAREMADRVGAFNGLLEEGGDAYVKRYAVSLNRAIELLVEAGGSPVIAHPWSRKSKGVLPASEFSRLRTAGLVGIEVDHADHSDSDRGALRAIAADLGLVVTGSSDYHGARKELALGCHTTAQSEYERLIHA